MLRALQSERQPPIESSVETYNHQLVVCKLWLQRFSFAFPLPLPLLAPGAFGSGAHPEGEVALDTGFVSFAFSSFDITA
jgi:hypothetical protein